MSTKLNYKLNILKTINHEKSYFIYCSSVS
jgi:hypothetical protein